MCTIPPNKKQRELLGLFRGGQQPFQLLDINISQSMVHVPLASESPKKFVRMQIPRPWARLTESDSFGVLPWNYALNKLLPSDISEAKIWHPLESGLSSQIRAGGWAV